MFLGKPANMKKHFSHVNDEKKTNKKYRCTNAQWEAWLFLLVSRRVVVHTKQKLLDCTRSFVLPSHFYRKGNASISEINTDILFMRLIFRIIFQLCINCVVFKYSIASENQTSSWACLKHININFKMHFVKYVFDLKYHFQNCTPLLNKHAAKKRLALLLHLYSNVHPTRAVQWYLIDTYDGSHCFF